MQNNPLFMLDNPKACGDPLSDVLSLVGVECASSVRFEMGGMWATHFTGSLPIEFGAVIEGCCWLKPEKHQEPIKLQPGDCYVSTGGLSYCIGTDLQADAVNVMEIFAHYRDKDGAVRYGSGVKTTIVCGGFRLNTNSRLLLDLLPPLFHIQAASDSLPILRSTLHYLADEASSRLGSKLMTESLAQILLVQVLRDYAASKHCPTVGWIGAFADRKIGSALRLMHSDRSQQWTLPELAAAVEMSRSGFALRFKTLVGLAPLNYLLRWRMQVAGHTLRETDRTISSVALDLGYLSESAFSNSFKRTMGCSPKHYRMRDDTTAIDSNQVVCLTKQS
jgi:AraC-like DNA-binding protein